MSPLVKSAIIYPWSHIAHAITNPDYLTSRLESARHHPIGQAEEMRAGFVSPTGDGHLVRSVGSVHLMALRIDTKILPPAVVEAAAQARATEIERTEGRKPGRKWMKQLKEECRDALLAQAFVRSETTLAWFDQSLGLVIASSSKNKAEFMLSKLSRADIDTKFMAPWRPRMPAPAVMTNWLTSREAPYGFTLDDRCAIATHDGGRIRVSHITLDRDEIHPLLARGSCEEIALTHADRMSFVLTDDLTLKGIKYLGVAAEAANAAQGNLPDIEDIRDAELAMAAGMIREAVEGLSIAMGGIPEATS